MVFILSVSFFFFYWFLFKQNLIFTQDDSVAPHEEETFINFVKKFELKRDGEEGDDEDDEEGGDETADEGGEKQDDGTPKKGRGGRVIKKRKIGYVS